jgi:hypothetical protein
LTQFPDSAAKLFEEFGTIFCGRAAFVLRELFNLHSSKITEEI